MAVQIRYADHIKEAFDKVQANLVPSVVCGAVCAIPLLNLLGPIVLVNYMSMVKDAKREGKEAACRKS